MLKKTREVCLCRNIDVTKLPEPGGKKDDVPSPTVKCVIVATRIKFGRNNALWRPGPEAFWEIFTYNIFLNYFKLCSCALTAFAFGRQTFDRRLSCFDRTKTTKIGSNLVHY